MICLFDYKETLRFCFSRVQKEFQLCPLPHCKFNGFKYGGGTSAFYFKFFLLLYCQCHANSLALSQPLTFPQVLLLGFAAHAIDPRHGLHVTLVNGRRVQNGLWSPSQADRQTCSAHQDTCHTWCMCTAQRRTNRHKRVDKAPTVSVFYWSIDFPSWSKIDHKLAFWDCALWNMLYVVNFNLTCQRWV